MRRDIDLLRSRRRSRDPLSLASFISPFAPISEVLDVDRWFDDVFGSQEPEGEGVRAIAPACDIEDDDSQFVLRMDMPGISKEDIQIDTTGNQMTISAERTESAKGRRFRTERYASFRRSFVLPTGIDPQKIMANYNNGVLEIAIPKTETGKARRIEIGTSQRVEKLAKPAEAKEQNMKEGGKEKAA